jgi:hypothetical protein
VNRAQLQQASLVRGGVPVAPTANNLRFSERSASAASVARTQAGNQRFFSRMPAGGVANGGVANGGAANQRTPFTQQQPSVRSGFGGGAIRPSVGGPQSPPAASGWSRFGEPGRSGGTVGVQPRSFHSGGGPVPSAPGSASGGWDRFGSPQRSVAPPQVQYNRPAYTGGSPAYQGSTAYQSRSLQVSPPIVQQRAAPGGGGYRSGPAPSYRSAPQGNSQGNRGGGGGGHTPSGGHGGHR